MNQCKHGEPNVLSEKFGNLNKTTGKRIQNQTFAKEEVMEIAKPIRNERTHNSQASQD